MSWLQNDLSQTLQRTPERLDQLSSLIGPQWITQVLSTTGKASIQRRKLPVEHAIWRVIGLALFRNQPIGDVARQLQLTLHNQPLSLPSAAVAGRQPLGDTRYPRQPLGLGQQQSTWLGWVASNSSSLPDGYVQS
jgi:hypothetical protein